MAAEIRRLTIDDYDALVNLWGDAGLSYRPFGRDTREKIEVEMKRVDTGFFGLFEDGRMVATGLATYDGRKGWLNRIAVHPDYRRHGYGTRMIKACEEFLESHGAEIIAMLIEGWNLPSMAMATEADYLHGDDIQYFSKRRSQET